MADITTVVSATIVVIGSSGSGKSTFLNAIARRQLFRTAASAGSVTQVGETNRRTIPFHSLSDPQVNYDLTLIDTPGFPDPNPEHAATYYDHVVEQCNQPINGVVFVLKQERTSPELMERYSTLLQEFVHLQTPLILLVNGLENPSVCPWEDDSELAERRRTAVEDLRSFALSVLQSSNLHARSIMVSYSARELPEIGRMVAHLLCSSPPGASRIPTFQEFQRQLAQYESTQAARERIERDAQARIARCNRDIAALREEAASHRSWSTTITWIPILGPIAASWWLGYADECYARISELQAEISRAEQTRRAVTDGDQNQLMAAIGQLRARVQVLRRFLWIRG